MAENYCGKNCEACSFKEKLSCSGCKTGPGRKIGGDCEIARCCCERGHDTCATCNQQSWCGKNRSSETMADIRLQKQERERAKREKLEKQMPLLANCLTVVFWVGLAMNIPSAMSNQLTVSLPGLYRTGQILSIILSLVIVGTYSSLRKVNDRYQKAAIYLGISLFASFVLNWITGGESRAWTLLVSIPAAVLSFAGKFQLYSANSEVLVPVDYELSEKWMKLWKWYIRLFGVSIAGLLLVVILPILGLLAVVAAAIGTIVVGIMELIYQYRMMDRFRTYAKNLAA